MAICSVLNNKTCLICQIFFSVTNKLLFFLDKLPSSQTLAPFWNNAINWLDQGRNGVVGVVPGLNQAFNLFSKSEFNCEKTNVRKDLSVFVCTAYSDNYVKEIQDFVAEGGGLLIGGHAWYWAQTHKGQNPMTDFSGMIMDNNILIML